MFISKVKAIKHITRINIQNKQNFRFGQLLHIMQENYNTKSEKSLSKQADTEFVCKLCDMMQKYPHIINWDSEGEKMIVFSPQKMEQIVLPQYFRHGNFSSFIRQLNMYNYHKLEKSELYNNDYIAFQHSIFKRGNQRNFHFIQRKKRIKEQEQSQLLFQKKNEHILVKLNDQDKLSQTTKESIQSLLQFKFTATQSSKKIKTELQNVYCELKDCRSRKISHALREIKDKVSQELTEQLQMSKMVDKFLESAFLVQKEKKSYFSNLMGSFYPSMQTDETYPIRDMMYDRNGVPAKQGYLSMASQCGFFSQMSFSDGQVPHPIFYSNPHFYSEMNYQCRDNNEQKKEALDSDDQNQDDSFSMGMMREEELQELLKNDQKPQVEQKKEKENQQRRGQSELIVNNGEMKIVFKNGIQLPQEENLKKEELE